MPRQAVLYLAYGSNLHPERLTARVGRPLAARTVRVDGWAIHFHKRSRDGSAKCDIVPHPEQHIYGVVYALTLAAKRRLDHIEGVGFGYSVTQIHVPELGNLSTYRAQDHAIDGDLRPYSWYHQLVLSGARHHGFPTHYLDGLRDVKTVEDPDPVRHDQQLRIISDPQR